MILSLNIILFFLQQVATQPQPFFTIERLGFLVALAVLALGNYWQFKTGRIQTIHETDTKVIASKDRLLGSQNAELEKIQEDYKKKCEDYDAIDLEFRALASFDIKELLNFRKMTKDLELKQLEIDVLTETVTEQKKTIVRLELNAKM